MMEEGKQQQETNKEEKTSANYIMRDPSRQSETLRHVPGFPFARNPLRIHPIAEVTSYKPPAQDKSCSMGELAI
jgi:hypothetical protein